MSQMKKPSDTSALWAAAAVLAVIRAKTTSPITPLPMDDRSKQLQDEQSAASSS